MAKKNIFFAYPGSDYELCATIKSAADKILNEYSNLNVKIWEGMDVFGKVIPLEVRNQINGADILFADVTFPNENVYYELGFAIGAGKPIAPVVNNSFKNALESVRSDGIFDAIGYKTYSNSDELTKIINESPSDNLLHLYKTDLNSEQPLFILDCPVKTEFRNAIISSVKDCGVFFRRFDPDEFPRMTTTEIIGDVTSSTAVIIPLLETKICGAEKHNLRAAFVAGLARSLGKPVKMLKLPNDAIPNPMDYRDDIDVIRAIDDISKSVEKFAPLATIPLQNLARDKSQPKSSVLQKLTLGATSAEKEFRSLSDYFVHTSEYLKTERREVDILAGRKGSGKTAIFYMVRDFFRAKNFHVVDLKPESHQLSLFREELNGLLGLGIFDHTISAFWYFVIVSEILIKVKEYYKHKSRSGSEYSKKFWELNEQLNSLGIDESGDFTTRLNRIGNYITKEIVDLGKRKLQITPERITGIIFKEGISKLKAILTENVSRESSIIFLFDNLDKGWPSSGVESLDIRILRLLVEVLDKVSRDLAGIGLNFTSTVFLRNDILELLVEDSPDKGKAGRLRIDWTDEAKLRQLIFKRLQSVTKDNISTFEQLWNKFFVLKIDNKDSFLYFVENCMMRPRFLLNIIENAISNAVNRGNKKVCEKDCVDAVKQFSFFLIDDFGYEIRDVSGLSHMILYNFIGVESKFNEQTIYERLPDEFSNEQKIEAFRLMLWYGIIGVIDHHGCPKFIYSYEYNFNRMNAEIKMLKENEKFVFNSIIRLALS